MVRLETLFRALLDAPDRGISLTPEELRAKIVFSIYHQYPDFKSRHSGAIHSFPEAFHGYGRGRPKFFIDLQSTQTPCSRKTHVDDLSPNEISDSRQSTNGEPQVTPVPPSPMLSSSMLSNSIPSLSQLYPANPQLERHISAMQEQSVVAYRALSPPATPHGKMKSKHTRACKIQPIRLL
jgi:hypothetical protein